LSPSAARKKLRLPQGRWTVPPSTASRSRLTRLAHVVMAAAVAVEDMEAAVAAAVMEVVVAMVVAAVVADTEVVDMAVAVEVADTEAVDMVEMVAMEEVVEVVVATAVVVVVMEVAAEAVVADMAVAATAEVVTRLPVDAVLLQKKHFVLRYFPFMLNLYYSAMQYCKTKPVFLAFYIRTETCNPKTPLRTLKKLYDRYDGVWTLTS